VGNDPSGEGSPPATQKDGRIPRGEPVHNPYTLNKKVVAGGEKEEGPEEPSVSTLSSRGGNAKVGGEELLRDPLEP